MGTPLVDPDQADCTLSCLFTFLAKASGPHFLMVQEVGASGSVANAMARALASHKRTMIGGPSRDWPALYRRPQPSYIEESLTPKQWRNLRRSRRLLEEQLGCELTLVDRAGETATVERFLQLEASGWKGRRGTALACDPRWADYFRKICLGFGGEGRLQILCLESGSTTVAMKVMTRAGEGVFELRAAYDERFARFSPGVLLEVQAIDHFHRGRDSWLMTNTNHVTSPLFRLWPDRCATTGFFAEWGGVGRHAMTALAGIVRAGMRRWRDDRSRR